MAVSQGSGEFLRGISALIQDKKQQRQSEQSMALTSLMFNLKREDAEKQRVTNVLGDAQKQIQDLSKTIEEKKVVFGQLGGSQEALKSINSGIKTDAGSILGATMSRMAGDVGGMQKSLESLKQLESQYRVADDELDKRIGAYSYGAGVAAQRAWRESGGDKGVIVGADGKVDKKELDYLLGEGSDFRKDIKKEYGKDVVEWSIFQSGFLKGLSDEETRAAKMKADAALTTNRNRVGPGRNKWTELRDIHKAYAAIERTINGKQKGDDMDTIMSALGVAEEDVAGMSREERIEQLKPAFDVLVEEHDEYWGTSTKNKFNLITEKSEDEGDAEFKKLMDEFMGAGNK